MDWISAALPHNMANLSALNMSLHIIHTAMVVFNCTGWILPQTRQWHRWCLGFTWVSWLAGGLYVGHIGYCILTDIHWQVLYRLGPIELPTSYIELMIRWFYPHDIGDHLIHNITAIVFIAVTLITLYYYRRDRLRKFQ